MPKPKLKEPWRTMEGEIIDTLLAGHHEWRPDLAYPESHSDMSGAVRGLLRMYEVKRRPIALEISESIEGATLMRDHGQLDHTNETGAAQMGDEICANCGGKKSDHWGTHDDGIFPVLACLAGKPGGFRSQSDAHLQQQEIADLERRYREAEIQSAEKWLAIKERRMEKARAVIAEAQAELEWGDAEAHRYALRERLRRAKGEV
jgi:hypothetical protein